MGHYDECRESDALDNVMKRSREANKQLQEFTKDASLSDKEFILEIIDDIKAYKGFFKILHKKK